MRGVLVLVIAAAVAGAAWPQDGDSFRVKGQPVLPPGPQITPYLQYQVAQAWEQDQQRAAEFAAIRTETDLRRVQARVRERLLLALGGLPQTKTPLNAKITGTIRLGGYRIEKLIFESLPGVFVTASLYVPDTTPAPKPAVLVPCGHSSNGKISYQYICHRLAKLGYVALCWDPVGQGERSQFWDKGKNASRYNLICAEHAVLGNLAYLAGANLARWEIWDGMRAVDYLLSRPDVDPKRICITGTSGGGTQTALIGALDERIGIVVPSCYINSLPMRMNNRIFKDPDSDPEQDLFEMVSGRIDHPGLLLLAYPRPVLMAVAVEDFFPIEGARRTFREIESIYRRLGHPERIEIAEGYHGHSYSPENLTRAFRFMNRFDGLPWMETLPAEEKLEDRQLLCTQSGQVMLEFKDAKPLTEVIRDYFVENRSRPGGTLRERYHGPNYPGIEKWTVTAYNGNPPASGSIAWQAMGSSTRDGLVVDKYLLHHSGRLSIPLLHVHTPGAGPATAPAVLWNHLQGKANAEDWSALRELAATGRQVLSYDSRGLGEDRMEYKAVSPDDPSMGQGSFDQVYFSPLSGVLENYVYNSLLTGRPYFLQLIEDAEIVSRFAADHLKVTSFLTGGAEDALELADAVAETLPGIGLLENAKGHRIRWSQIVLDRRELWPIQYLLPGGAYIR
jgi:hypothetical protein